ncbi:MAG TPA: condensation domain-containing protein, partial [Thermoanaerobaculia bacterium]|nr:condensation domain-containing protein [Thermoanaerobaculia bacterium]
MNGKVDRRALPAPGESESRGEGHVAPRGPVEELLAGIWEEVLRRERLGVTDDFFALGGHSLLATQVVSRVRRALQVELPLKVLFESPTIAALARAIERARRGGEGADEGTGEGTELPPLAHRPRVASAGEPLSFAQERLWFIDQLEPESAQYNIPAALELNGPLRPAALAWALGEVERRHEVLRTAFAEVGDTPVQRIGAAREPFPLPVVDLSGLTARAREEQVVGLAGAEAGRPFDLARGPVWRAALLCRAKERYVLLLTLHHIAADGWSIGVLVQEVAELYAAATAGRPERLPELAIQYADYAVWQREWLTGEVLELQLAYWRRQLAGAPAVLDLPTDRPRPAVQTFVGGTLSFILADDLARDLERLSRGSGATLFMALLAAFQALLGRYSGQEDVVVGTPVAGRNHVLTEGLIGFFVNTLAIRTRLAGEPDFLELLARVREGTLSAFDHQDLPFEKLVGELQIERNMSHAPLFQVVFALQNAPAATRVIPGLALAPLAVDSGTAKFDLTAIVAPAGGGLSGLLEYNRDLFDRTTAQRLAGGFVRWLEAAVAAPAASLGQLSLLSTAERHQVLWEWNGTPGEPGWGGPLARLLAARAAANPGAPAVIGGDTVLTYDQLYGRAARVARRLRELGVGPGTRVGLCLERSPDLIVGLLATLGAGGAYVTLDPSYPEERLAFLLADCGAAVLVTRSDLGSRLPAGGPALLLLDREEDLPSEEGAFPTGAGLEDLFYVIYTSGSTGLPKGAGVYQRGFVNLLRWYVEELGLSAADRFL